MSFHQPKSRFGLDILRHYLADIVYGGNDGIVTTFAVISGVAGAQLSTKAMFVITSVSLLADGFSMAASNFLAIRSKAEAHGLSRGALEPTIHAMATFIAFIIFGSMPLFGFFLYKVFLINPFAMSAVVTALTMFVLGAVRSAVSHRRWYMTGLENLIIGAIASFVAYYGGMLVARLVN